MIKKAQAIFDFTLIIIPFFIVFFGIIQIVHIFIIKIIVSHAAFMTIRVAIVNDRFRNIRLVAYNNIQFKCKKNINVEVRTNTEDSEVEIRLIENLKLILHLLIK